MYARMHGHFVPLPTGIYRYSSPRYTWFFPRLIITINRSTGIRTWYEAPGVLLYTPEVFSYTIEVIFHEEREGSYPKCPFDLYARIPSASTISIYLLYVK